MKRKSKKPARHLQLNRTTVRHLQSSELGAVVGGASSISDPLRSCSITSNDGRCVEDQCFHAM